MTVVDLDPPDVWDDGGPLAYRFPIGREVRDSFYESSGLRAEEWADELPDSVVGEFGRGGGGMFGEYFGFD